MADRQFYEPEGGKALRADNTVLDVTAWREALSLTVETVGEEIEANNTAEHAATRTQIDAVATAVTTEGGETQSILSTIDADTGSIDTKLTTTNSNLSTINSTISSDGALTRAEIDAEALAGRTNETSEHNATRATIESVGEEIEANITAEQTITRATIESVGEEIEANITAEHTTTRAAIESVGEEIETALTIEHPRIIRTAYDQIGIDAGGRQRVSQLTTLMDGKVVNGHTPLIFESAGTGTQTVGNSKNNMAVTSGQWSIFQTKRFYPYFSGKSQTVECTFDGFAPQADVVKRFGYFSSNAVSPFDTTYDGMWCENDGTTIRLRMNRSGTTTLNVPITSWSGYANLGEYQNLASWDNFTVCIFDFLWLGGAVMRFWIKTQSGFILAHVFRYAGTAQDIFMLEPCKPLRYEIRSSTGSGSFRYICSQIATEGSFEEDGIVRAVTTGFTAIACTTIGTTYPLIAIRKQSAYRCVASRLSDFNIFVSSANDRMLYTVQINPTLSAPLTYADVVNSSVQSAIGNGTITVTTTGIIMATGFLAQNSILPSGLLEHNFLSYMGGTLSNVMDEYILCGTPITSGIDTYSSLAYKEY
jgi:hypothetical protein